MPAPIRTAASIALAALLTAGPAAAQSPTADHKALWDAKREKLAEERAERERREAERAERETAERETRTDAATEAE